MQVLVYLLFILVALWLTKKAYLYYLDKEVEIEIQARKDSILKADAIETDVADFALLHGSEVKTENKDKFLKGEKLNG